VSQNGFSIASTIEEAASMSPTVINHNVRGTQVRLMRQGSGEPLLFLHGAGGFGPWGEFHQALSNHFDVMVPEHPGFGDPDNGAFIRNIADMAMYYLDFLDGLHAGAVHLVGTSLGGWIAAEVAIRNSSHLASLSLLAPAGIRVKGVPIGDNFIWSPEEALRNLFFDQSYADALLATAPADEEVDRQLISRFMAARLGWEPRWFNPSLRKWLHRIQVPSLVLWGAQDQLFPAVYAQHWGESIPGARVRTVDNAGHLMHVEAAHEVSAHLLSFITGRSI
jgi:pimeloyl-ACP methyl ester carboxylesterase